MALPLGIAASLLAAGLLVAACENPMKKKEEEAARNTFACEYNGERLVIKYDEGEARMLMGNLQRITLYQLPTPSGVRYSNGTLELRGKGPLDVALVADGLPTPLRGCMPYTPPPVK